MGLLQIISANLSKVVHKYFRFPSEVCSWNPIYRHPLWMLLSLKSLSRLARTLRELLSSVSKQWCWSSWWKSLQAQDDWHGCRCFHSPGTLERGYDIRVKDTSSIQVSHCGGFSVKGIPVLVQSQCLSVLAAKALTPNQSKDPPMSGARGWGRRDQAKQKKTRSDCHV